MSKAPRLSQGEHATSQREGRGRLDFTRKCRRRERSCKQGWRKMREEGGSGYRGKALPGPGDSCWSNARRCPRSSEGALGWGVANGMR